MKFGRKAHPEQSHVFGNHMDIDITELLEKAADAGYTEEQAITAILNVAKYQAYLHGRQRKHGPYL
jgi:hypothetical protein